jgi:hypothetical protein
MEIETNLDEDEEDYMMALDGQVNADAVFHKMIRNMSKESGKADFTSHPRDPQALSSQDQLLDDFEFEEPDYSSLPLTELEELDIITNLAIVENFKNFKEESRLELKI